MNGSINEEMEGIEIIVVNVSSTEKGSLDKLEQKVLFILSLIYRMIKSRPLDYAFVPRTWIFPAEYTQFQNYMKELKKKRKQKTFIVKPANGAMGHGQVFFIWNT